jgi:D-threo-aldose 1-dehydrogenase
VHVDRDLLTDEGALGQRLMPTGAAQGIDVVIGGPYNSGILAGGTRYEYQDAPAEISAKVACTPPSRGDTTSPIKAAALQFSLAHPATAAVIPGASMPERIAEDYAALNTKIPDDFWHEMRPAQRLRVTNGWRGRRRVPPTLNRDGLLPSSRE